MQQAILCSSIFSDDYLPLPTTSPVTFSFAKTLWNANENNIPSASMIACSPMGRLASNSLGKNGQSSAAGVLKVDGSAGGDVNQPANLNILNQANNISQLSVNDTSFDPNLLVANSSEMTQQADGVITAFSGLVVQGSNGDNGSAVAAAVGSTTSMNGSNNLLRVSPTLQQPHVVLQTANQTLVQSNSSNISPPTVSPPPNASVMVQQPQVTHHHQSQMPYHHVQPLQPKPMQNGRVPATKHDNRKLFVGGLPNEGK